MSKPTAFPLDESKLPFEIPKDAVLREKIVKLGQMITDRIPAKNRPLTAEEYEALKALALRSAEDFLTLYRSIPDKTHTTLPQRETFYGDVPLTAEEMYRHTKNVNAYYFGEIGVEVGNEPDILICRRAGFAALERQPRYLHNAVFHGSYDEDWTLRKGHVAHGLRPLRQPPGGRPLSLRINRRSTGEKHHAGSYLYQGRTGE